jgi:hypothetical protein
VHTAVTCLATRLGGAPVEHECKGVESERCGVARWEGKKFAWAALFYFTVQRVDSVDERAMVVVGERRVKRELPSLGLHACRAPGDV